MSHIEPNDPSLLTDLDVDYGPFRCCGDEDLVFLRCRHCGHIWVECYECSTWYVALGDLIQVRSSFLSDVSQRLACPSCDVPFGHFYYLGGVNGDGYLATAEQVIQAGHGRFLSAPLREKHGVE